MHKLYKVFFLPFFLNFILGPSLFHSTLQEPFFFSFLGRREKP